MKSYSEKSVELDITEQIKRQKETIAEQLQTIVALNDCIGGKGSLTTDNLVLVGRLEAEIERQAAEIKRLEAELTTLKSAFADRVRVIEMQLKDKEELQAENARLHQALRNAYEVYAGSEGIPMPETAAEAYLYQLLNDMKYEIANGLSK